MLPSFQSFSVYHLNWGPLDLNPSFSSKFDGGIVHQSQLANGIIRKLWNDQELQFKIESLKDKPRIPKPRRRQRPKLKTQIDNTPVVESIPMLMQILRETPSEIATETHGEDHTRFKIWSKPRSTTCICFPSRKQLHHCLWEWEHYLKQQWTSLLSSLNFL